MLTPEAIAKYVKHPYNCPYCNYDAIEVVNHDFEMDIASRKCKCMSCNMRWIEVFQLTDIEEGFA